MSKSRRFESYPSQLIELVLKFEEGMGEPYIIHGLANGMAHRVRAELYGLRRAIERDGRGLEFPAFMSARLYVRGDDLAIMSADKLDWAIELGTILSRE